QQILDGFLAEIVIDAIDLMFGEGLAYHGVQRARALEAVAERLLDDHPHPRGRPGTLLLGRDAACVEVTDYLRVHAGRNCQIEQAAPCRGARAVPVHRLQPRRPERRVVETLSRDADHGEAGREEAVLAELIQCGDQLAACEVASGAADDERARLRRL